MVVLMIWLAASSILSLVYPAANQFATSVEVCGTDQSSLCALAKLAETILTAGVLAKCVPGAVIIAFFFPRYTGSQKTGIVHGVPLLSKVKNFCDAGSGSALIASNTQLGVLPPVAALPPEVPIRSRTFFPLTAAVETTLSRKLKSKTPSVGSRSYHRCRTLMPSTLGSA